MMTPLGKVHIEQAASETPGEGFNFLKGTFSVSTFKVGVLFTVLLGGRGVQKRNLTPPFFPYL